MLTYFWYGLFTYTGTLASPDGWSYIAVGQYIWKYPIGTEGGLAPLYQYASHLAHSRFISSAFLGFFSPFVGQPGDTQTASNLLPAWLVFVFASSCMFFATTQKTGKIKIIYVVLVILSGWMLKVIDSNNYDNLLVLGFLPVLSGIVTIYPNKKYQYSILLGLILSAVVYCYPEMAAFILVSAIFLIIFRIYTDGKSKIRQNALLVLYTLKVWVILTLPYIKESIYYVISQYSSTTGTNRIAGNAFHELLNPLYFLTTYWSGLHHNILFIIPAILLTTLSIFGLIKMASRKQYDLLSIAGLLFAGSIVMLLCHHYPYGAYKFILLNLWLLFFTVIIGVNFTYDYYKNMRLLLKKFW